MFSILFSFINKIVLINLLIEFKSFSLTIFNNLINLFLNSFISNSLFLLSNKLSKFFIVIFFASKFFNKI